MNIQISPLQPKAYPQVIELLDQEKRFPYLPDAFTPLWSVTPDGLAKALWSITAGGEWVGSAGYVVAESDRTLASLGLIIAPAFRQQGIGDQVYRALLAALQKRGIERVLTKLYVQQLAGMRFLACRGFCPCGMSIHSQLHVDSVQLAQWADPATLVAQHRLHFTTLDRFPRFGLAERLLPIWNRTRPDQPQDWPYVPFSAQRLEGEILESAELALSHSFAIVTADQQVVALTLNLHYPAVGVDNRLFTVYSAVDPDFRRRKLATALKLKLIAHAQAHGIAFLAAENDERNQAMWQINHSLGYRPLAELVVYQKTIFS
jgi:ribosomal protein S18 acetylase RimI-like enzyme